VRAVLLDALGTLVALEAPAPRLRAQLAAVGITVSEEQAAAAIGAEITYYRAHLDEGRDTGTLAALRARCAEEVRSALPPSVELDAIGRDAMTEVLLSSLRFTAFADVAPALQAWRALGLRLVVVSNWDVSLHGVLGRLGIARWLDGIVTSAEVGARKPSPVIFERALALAECSPDASVHIGDNADEDVAGARAAGIAPILIMRSAATRAPTEPDAVRTIASLADFDPVAVAEA
jgi:putative hydrolase of the HAD superfamily